jgi:hypothetical protein
VRHVVRNRRTAVSSAEEVGLSPEHSRELEIVIFREAVTEIATGNEHPQACRIVLAYLALLYGPAGPSSLLDF